MHSYACMKEEHAHMLNGVHILLITWRKKCTVVKSKVPAFKNECLTTFSLVMQELKGREKRLLVSRNPVFMFMLASALVQHLV
jgi:hypothetical protein